MIIILLFIALLLLVIFGFHREQFDRYRKSSKGVRNHDHQLREFLYRTDLSADEVRGVCSGNSGCPTPSIALTRKQAASPFIPISQTAANP